jgi:hypothetical protein
VTDETVVADRNEFAYERMGLDAAARANRRTSLDLDERSDEATCANRAAVEIHRPDDLRTFAKRHVLDGRVPKGGAH